MVTKKNYKNKKRKTQVYKHKISKKRVYNKKNKVLKGGDGDNSNIDSEGALILNNTKNTNGKNHCWLNATLYAFVAFKPILDIYNDFKCSENNTFTLNDYVIIEGLNDTIVNKEKYSIKDIEYRNIYENNENSLIYVTIQDNDPDTKKQNIITQLDENLIEFILDKKLAKLKLNNFQRTQLQLVVKTSCLKHRLKLTEEDNKIYKEIYNLMLESRNQTKNWDATLYNSIHSKLCEVTRCGINKPNENKYDITNPDSGEFSNPQPVLVTFSEILLKKCHEYKSPLRTEAMTICAHNNDERNKDYNNLINGIKTESIEAMQEWKTYYSEAQKQKIIELHKKKKIKSIIVSDFTSEKNTKNKNRQIDLGHFIAYSRHSELDLWKKYDSGITIDDYTYNRDNMFPINTDPTKTNHVWYIYAIYFDEDYSNNLSKIQMVEQTSICNLLTSYKK
jgi:hypothetical protein